MSSNMESPQSVSSVVYYRGVSITITKRDVEVKIQPLIEDQIKLIDWMLDQKGAKPSWNEETNKQATQSINLQAAQPIKKSEPIEEEPEETKRSPMSCWKCGAGWINNPKTGKWFCKEKCWLKD